MGMSTKELTETEKYRIAIDALKAVAAISEKGRMRIESEIVLLREGLAEALARENRDLDPWKKARYEFRNVRNLLNIHDQLAISNEPGGHLNDISVTVWSMRNWIKWTTDLDVCHRGQMVAIDALQQDLKQANQQIAELSVKLCQKSAEIVLLKNQNQPALQSVNGHENNWEVE